MTEQARAGAVAAAAPARERRARSADHGAGIKPVGDLHRPAVSVNPVKEEWYS